LNLLKNFDYFEYNDAKFNSIHICNQKLRSLYTYFRKDLSRKKQRERRCREKMKFTKLLRSKKAISPIFATLILIAIAVIAGIVVYMFTSGTIASMTSGGTTGTEKLQIQTVYYDDSTAGSENLDVYCKVIAGGDITIESATVKDSGGVVVEVIPAGTAITYVDAASGTPTLNIPAAGTLTIVNVAITALPPGSYTVTLSTESGGVFVSSAFQV
jgi:flagellin-like protein